MKEFNDIYVKNSNDLERTNIIKYKIKVITDVLISQKSYIIINFIKKKKLKKELERMK